MLTIIFSVSSIISSCLTWQPSSLGTIAFKSLPTGHAFTLTSIPQQKIDEWMLYRGTGEKFSVSLPAQPSGHSSMLSNQSGKQRVQRSYAAYAEGVVYVILSYDRAGRHETITDIIRDFKEFHLIGGDLSFEHDLTLGNFTGKQFRSNGGSAFDVTQFYVTDKHAYVVHAVSLEEHSPSVQRFLSSFTLGSQTSVKKTSGVDSLAGMQSSAPPTSTSSTTAPTDADQKLENVLSVKDVTRKAVLVLRHQPGYTEDARRNNVSGAVKLRLVLGSTGDVTRIAVVKGLPNGLTDLAIEATRRIKFIPAMKDGRFVSQYAVIEYSFGLY